MTTIMKADEFVSLSTLYNNPNRGFFFTIEGGVGSHKGQLCSSVASQLDRAGLQTMIIDDPALLPQYMPLVQSIRHYYAPQRRDPLAEMFVEYGLRLHLVEELILPALNRGVMVLSHGFELSSSAYYNGGHEILDRVCYNMRVMSLGDFVPDLTICIDQDPIESLHAVQQRDPEAEVDAEFMARVRAHFRDNRYPSSPLLNGNEGIDMLRTRISEHITGFLEEHDRINPLMRRLVPNH